MSILAGGPRSSLRALHSLSVILLAIVLAAPPVGSFAAVDSIRVRTREHVFGSQLATGSALAHQLPWTRIGGSPLSNLLPSTLNRQLIAPASGQVVVDSQNPAWLRYHGGSPFFMCGPGDPEDFFYRGTRNSNGSRSGDQQAIVDKLGGSGANSIYLMAVRSHGGDGASTHNPFVDSDPAKGLDEDILQQWDDWLGQLDSAGILIFFIFYDDSASIWDTGDNVGGAEKAFISALVNRYENLKHLIWVVAEEYTEAFSATRAASIAAEIKAADDRDHPVAIHKRNGLNFSEFANSPAIDQFAIQYTANSSSGFHDALVSAWADADGRYNLNMAEGHPDAFGDFARRRSWAVAMGGGYVMHLRWDVVGTDSDDLADCGRLVSFMESTDFNTMAPHDELAHGSTDYVLANPGSSYIAYSDSAGSSLGIQDLTSGTYDLKWLDTASGSSVTLTGVGVTGGDTLWSKPSPLGSEVALYAKRTGALQGLPGDVNGDGVVNVQDVQLCVNQVLGLSPTTPEADVNSDGSVNVLDVQLIVNILLGG